MKLYFSSKTFFGCTSVFILIDIDVKDLCGSCETTNKQKIRVSRLQFEEIGICFTFYRNNL